MNLDKYYFENYLLRRAYLRIMEREDVPAKEVDLNKEYEKYMKVYRIQCNTADEDGISHSFLPGIYISREIAEKHKPEDYEWPWEEVTYEVRFTNRSEYTVVVADGYGSAEENVITLKGETRKEINGLDIVLSPGESKTFTFTYTKFVDDGDSISDMTFGSIRVMEQYSGTDLNKVTEDQINQEINNAVDKFSMKLAL